MQVFTARVRGGAIVPEQGSPRPWGTTVTVKAAEGESEAFETTPEEARELPSLPESRGVVARAWNCPRLR
jgi:hypothetical protein